MWWLRAYSTLVQTYTYDLFFLLLQTASHYAQTAYTYDLSITFIRSQAQGCLTTKNPIAMPSCLSVVASCFFQNFFSLFVIFLLFVTFINYFLLLRKARGIILLYLLHCLRGASVPIHMIWPLRPQGQGLGAVWPPKRVRSGA